MKTTDYKSFSYLENGDIVFSEYDTIKSSSKLDAGSYKLDYKEHPKYITTLKMDFDFEVAKLHNFPDKEKIDTILNSFFNSDIKNKIEGLGFCHKIGILLYGTEGTGKSSIIKYYCNYAIKNHNAIVLHMLCKNSYISSCWNFVQNIRSAQDNPIIIVFDEFDQQIKENEAYLKTVIDGNMSITNCIFFASTNYIDKIPKAMSDRPSRFKYSLNIEGIQVKQDIIQIITPILHDIYTVEQLDMMANELRGNTLDYIKQFCFDKLMDITHYGKTKKKIGF